MVTVLCTSNVQLSQRASISIAWALASCSQCLPVVSSTLPAQRIRGLTEVANISARASVCGWSSPWSTRLNDAVSDETHSRAAIKPSQKLFTDYDRTRAGLVERLSPEEPAKPHSPTCRRSRSRPQWRLRLCQGSAVKACRRSRVAVWSCKAVLHPLHSCLSSAEMRFVSARHYTWWRPSSTARPPKYHSLGMSRRFRPFKCVRGSSLLCCSRPTTMPGAMPISAAKRSTRAAL